MWFTEEWTDNTRFSLKYEKHILSTKSNFQKIDFYKSKEWGTFFTLDNLLMLTEKDEFIYHDMIVHPAMATNPSVEKVLVIGGGDGGTVRELCRYKNIKQIDMVEIDKKVVDLSKKYLPTISHSLTDKRVKLFFEDGINFVEKSKSNTYDLILVDSTDPVGPGEGLFTTDFYKNCFRILNNTGILINQHESPYFKNYETEMIRAHTKIKHIFPISEVYQFHQAVYPSGHWLFGFASKKFHPINDQQADKWESLNIETKYYNSNLHIGCFYLPSYVLNKLNKN